MVRVNIVPPSELYDQHLIAEYDEILMLCSCLVRTLKSKKGFQASRIPERYKLNKGHIYFFYNKGKYLHKRFESLKAEMRQRGFKPQKEFPRQLWPDFLYKDWIPESGDFKIIRERIRERLNQKLEWYRKTIK